MSSQWRGYKKVKELAHTFSLIVFLVNRLYPGNYFNKTVAIDDLTCIQKGLNLYSFQSISIIYIYLPRSISHTKRSESIFISIYLHHLHISTMIYIAYKEVWIYIHFNQIHIYRDLSHIQTCLFLLWLYTFHWI